MLRKSYCSRRIMFAIFLPLVLCVKTVTTELLEDCITNVPTDKYLQVYGPSCFQFVSWESLDYNFAENYCENHGGTLVLIKNAEIQDYIHNQIINNYKYQFAGDVWLGLNDKAQEDSYVWEDGTPVVYSNWGDGEGLGNKASSDEEDCVALNANSGKWKTENCTHGGYALGSAHHQFICQFKLKLSGTLEPPVTTTTTTTTTTMLSTEEPTTTAEIPDVATPCPPFQCDLDCGLSGYRKHPDTGCAVCECDE